MKVEKVNINGEVFENNNGIEWYDDINVFHPDDVGPYWQIDFYVKGNLVKRIITTGNVTVYKIRKGGLKI